MSTLTGPVAPRSRGWETSTSPPGCASTRAKAETARLITLWETAADEERARTSRGSMRDQLATTAGMDVIDFGVFEVPAWEILPEGVAQSGLR
jgi:hypothetical protein